MSELMRHSHGEGETRKEPEAGSRRDTKASVILGYKYKGQPSLAALKGGEAARWCQRNGG